ncbi:MAG: carboxypeptidase regulatory-like domain-containing protein [Phycicoccus sp.]|nr:carboxypeptidase regulatory-like domain-containing protein [Phycicoccus sp.]
MVVAAGVAKTGINAALPKAGGISGMVTDAGGTHHGLADVQVQVSSSSTGVWRYATTAADGSYTVTGLPAGTDYSVWFDGSGASGGSSDAFGYAYQGFDNQTSLGTPTLVAVAAGVVRTGVNAAMLKAGAISGLVTDAGGTHHGLADVWVNVFSPSTGGAGSATTAADGSYTVTGLYAGNDYQVCFYGSGASGGSSDATGYIDQCYLNQPTSDTATPVAVTLGVAKTGINALLVGNP